MIFLVKDLIPLQAGNQKLIQAIKKIATPITNKSRLEGILVLK